MGKKYLLMTFLVAIIGFCGTSLSAQNVAKVGNTEYATIDKAIAAWTNNTTLTLLADVTLSDVIKLSSTEYHILDLGTYTMTAASGKDAIQYVVNGRSSASYALDIKADAVNPGGITATGGSVVRHTKPMTNAPSKDRPITRFYGGVFNASYVVRQGGTFGAGYTGASAPHFYFYDGEYNGTIYTNRSIVQFHGGVFNGSIQMSVDSSSYGLVAGGTFKNLSNSMGSALNSDKFTIGSAKGVYDKEVYIDDNGNYVVAATEPAQGIEADVAKTPGTNDYLAYSKVATEGQLGYTDVYTALEKNTSATVTVYVEELDLEDSNFKGTIVVPENSTITITNAPEGLKVTDEEGNELTSSENGEYTTIVPVEVATYDELVAALANGGVIKLTADITVDTKITAVDGTVIDLNDNTLYVNVENSYYDNVIIKNGNIVLGKDDVHVCDGYFLVNAGKTLELNGVNVSSSAEGIKGYAVFHLKTGANLDLINSTLNIADNEYTAGYIVYAGEETATVDVTGTTITGSKVNGIVHATTVIDESTVTLTNVVEHGINRSGVTIDDSNVTISGGTGRGITAQHGPLNITGNSVVSISEMGEATIELRNNQNLTVEETATVTVDAAVNNTTSGTITGNVIIDASVGKVAKIGDTYYKTLQEAIDACEGENNLITLLNDITFESDLNNAAKGYFNIADGKNVVLDMNGKTINVTDKSTGNFIVFYNYGEFTIANGTINLTSTNDREWNAESAIFLNRGGIFNIENGKYTHNGGTAMAFVVDNSGNYYGDATTNIYERTLQRNTVKTTLTSSYIAIRNRMEQNTHGASGKAILNVEGGTISGTSRAIWAQAASTSETAPATGEINVKGGNIGLIDTPRSTGAVSMTTISGGEVSAFKGEAGELTVTGGTLNEVTLLTAAGETVDDYVVNEDGLYVQAVAKIGETSYETLQAAVDAVQNDQTITLLADAAEDVTIPAGVTFNGNGKAVGNIKAAGTITFNGHTKATSFNVENTNTTINIVEGACLEITGTGRMVIGHGCTFNITGSIADDAAKTANVADLTPSLIMPGASFTGAGVTFNVTNAYIKTTASYCSSSKSASSTFDFDIKNSIWEQFGKLAFESQSVNATVNFDLENSVLTTTSHLVFGVSRGEVVIDNSNVNVGTSRQIENQSTMTIKNGSVVNGAVATSSNAINPGTIIVENATYAVTGEFSGAAVGTGNLIIKKGANVSVGSIKAGANVTVDAEGMAAGDEINFTADLSQFTGTLSVINNDKLEAKIVDGKIVLAAKPVAKIGDVEYATLKGAIAEVEEGQTIEFLAGTIEEGTIKLPATLKNVTFKGAADNTSILKDMTIMASDGNSFSYIGLTFDGIQFDNSRIVFTGWRNGEETIEDLTITNCIVKNLYDDTNMAFLHINKGASEPVKNLTFTNNVLDGVTGGSKSGIYSVNTGKVIIKGNTFNNIVFRPALVQLSDCDGIVDNVEISNNEISNTTRLQVYGTEVDNGDGTYTPTGTDELAVKINNNIFKNISGYYICTWGINGDYDISKNYYDSDNLSEKIYWNNEKPSTVNGLYELGVYPVYTELNDDGTINIESAFTPELNYVAQVGETNYINLADAVEAVKTNGGTLTLLDDVSESLTFNTEDKTPLASPIEIIINLNGKTVTSEESTLWVSDGYVVTVKDETGEGKIITTSGSDEAFAIARGGKIILESGNVVGVGYGVYLYNGGATGEEELVVNGGTIEVPNGGTAIAIGNGKVTVNNGKVICNKTPNGEGWNTYVYENGTLEIKGGEFLGSIGNFGRTSISGGTFSYPDDPNDGFNDEHLAAGYTTEINADGSIKVVALPAAPDGFVWVNNYEQLVAALENDNAKVIMANDIIGDATQSSGYGKAGVVLNAGDILDGNNKKLTINGANTTWDCAVAMLGGEVRNLTISGAFRGVFMPGANGNVLIDNCVFDGVTYTFNSDAGSTDYSVTIKESELNGWTSFSNVHGSVTFENCIFDKGNDYARCVPYQETTFVGCDFAEGFTVNTATVEDNDLLTFNGCTYAGEPISAENGMDMFYNGGEVLVDGESIDYTRCAQIVRGEETLQFITLQAAINAAQENETITLLIDTELSEMITIPNGKTVVLDLNGKTITGTDNTSKNFSIINNRGNLTITDSSDPSTGKITLTATIDSDWSRYSAVIANNPGGKLTIEAGTLEHLGGTDMAYGIDNLTNGKGTYAETVINGGYIKSTYRGIRQFLNGVEAQNILTVNGGTIEGANKSIWMQDPNKNANTGTLTVDEKATLKGDVYLSATAGSTEWPVEVSIAAAALAEGSEVLTSNLPLGVDVQNINGTYGRVNVVAQIGDVKYQSLAAAVSAAQSGATITLMNGEHELPLFANKELTFVGESKDGVIVNDAPAAVTQGWNGSTFHFENLTAKGATENYHGLANGVVAVTYNNCNINGLRFLYATEGVSFDGCAFNANGVEHSFWTYGASNVTVTNSTFTYTDRAVNCYSENGAEHKTDITFEGCSFTYAGTNDTPEGAVEINSGSVKSINLTMNGCTAPEKGAMWFNSKWDSKNGENTVVVVDDVKVWPFAAKIGETGYASLAEALTAAQTANLSDVEITIVGVNTQETADDFNLYEQTVFNNVTIKQDNGNKPYYVKCIYSGKRSIAEGQFVFDGVNVVITEQYITQCKTVLKNNSVVKRTDDAKNFIYYADMFVESGSKYDSQIDDILGGSVTVDGGRTDGTYNTEFDLRSIFFDVRTGQVLTAKNGAYVIFNAANEIGRLTLNGKLSVQASKVEVFNNIPMGDGAVIELDTKRLVSAKVITGAGKIVVDATGFAGEDVEVINADMSGFTGTIEVIGDATYEIVDSKVVIKAPTYVAKVGDDYYATIQDAIDAAVTGQTVVLLENIELTEADCVAGADRNVLVDVAGKDITLDMNEKKISVTHMDEFTNDYIVAVIRVADGAGLTVTGNGTIEVNVLADNPDIAYMFWKRGTTGHLTILNGTFRMNDAADSMVYTNGNEIVFIKGGNWTLDAYGTRGNREPWIFNVAGAGDKHVIVTGGTFNADINRQHWSNEVIVPETHYTEVNTENIDDEEITTYTVKDGAEAYVATGMLTGPYFYRKNIGYATLEEALAKAQEFVDPNVTLLKNITLENTITVNAGKDVILDLNGKTISGKDKNASGSFNLFVNKGTFEIKDDSAEGTGKITLEATTNRYWNASSSIVSNSAGTLTITSGTLEHLGGTDMAYAIDNNSTLGLTTLNVDGGKIASPYRAIRQFQNSLQDNIVVVNGGTISARAGIWMQQPSTNDKAQLGTLTINDGSIFECVSNAVVIDICGGAQSNVTINGGTFRNTNVNANLLLIWPLTDMNSVHENCSAVMNITGGNFTCAGEGKLIGILDGADTNGDVVLTGGIYSEDVNAYCAEGFATTNNGNGTWTVMPAQEQHLVAGWNWYSTYLDINGAQGLTKIENALGDKGIQILSHLDGWRLYEDGEWYGELAGTDVKKMYKIEVGEGGVDMRIAGNIVDFTNETIEIVDGFNWISYPFNQPMNLNDALSGFTPAEGDYIISHFNFAFYYDNQWEGSLESFTPGEGYIYERHGSNTDLSYNVSNTRGAVKANVTTDGNKWMPNGRLYPNNMTMIAVVDGLANGNYEVAAFVNGEVRGSARPIYIESLDAYMLFLTIHGGDEVEEMSFRLYDIDNDTEYDLSDRINYSNNAHLGSVNEPYVFSRGTTGIGEASMSEVNIYPNPTTTGTEINLEATCDKVEVFNALGVKVAEYQNVDSIDALETAGIYVIRITNNGNVQNCRLVVK